MVEVLRHDYDLTANEYIRRCDQYEHRDTVPKQVHDALSLWRVQIIVRPVFRAIQERSIATARRLISAGAYRSLRGPCGSSFGAGIRPRARLTSIPGRPLEQR